MRTPGYICLLAGLERQIKQALRLDPANSVFVFRITKNMGKSSAYIYINYIHKLTASI